MSTFLLKNWNQNNNWKIRSRWWFSKVTTEEKNRSIRHDNHVCCFENFIFLLIISLFLVLTLKSEQKIITGTPVNCHKGPPPWRNKKSKVAPMRNIKKLFWLHKKGSFFGNDGLLLPTEKIQMMIWEDAYIQKKYIVQLKNSIKERIETFS